MFKVLTFIARNRGYLLVALVVAAALAGAGFHPPMHHDVGFASGSA